MSFAQQLHVAKGDLTARQVAAAVSPLLSVRTVEKWLANINEPPLWAHDWLLSCVTSGGNLLSHKMRQAGKAGAAKASERLKKRWTEEPEKQRAIQAAAAKKGTEARAKSYIIYRPDGMPPIRVTNLFAWVRSNQALLGYKCQPKSCVSGLLYKGGWQGWKALEIKGQNAEVSQPEGEKKL